VLYICWELIAYGRDELEIAKGISADWVVYQVCVCLCFVIPSLPPLLERMISLIHEGYAFW